MGYQVRPRTSRGVGRRPDRAKLKPKTDKERSMDSHQFTEENVPTSKEVLDRTLNSLRHLGEQRFAIAPFYEHFGRWFQSLQTVLAEFESSPSITVDDQFRRKCSEILSAVELNLDQKRLKEISFEESMRKINQSLRDARTLMAQTEREHAAKMRKIADQEEHEVKPVASKVGRFREELNRIARSKPGFLSILMKGSAHKETEATRKLNSTTRELEKIEQSFSGERKRLEDEYKQKRQNVPEQIARLQREIEGLQTDTKIDDAVEIRREACEGLTSALNSLLCIRKSMAETSSSPS
jgi:vacuolar-type H+-ATPase subunit I/STV1